MAITTTAITIITTGTTIITTAIITTITSAITTTITGSHLISQETLMRHLKRASRITI
jgi:hypothetical protein